MTCVAAIVLSGRGEAAALIAMVNDKLTVLLLFISHFLVGGERVWRGLVSGGFGATGNTFCKNVVWGSRGSRSPKI